jgi:hypothetical protein
MIITYHDHGEPDERLRRYVERRAEMLGEWVSHLNDDSAYLDVTIFYDLRTDDYTTELCLRIAGQQIDATGEGLQRTQSLERAFRELAERVDIMLTRLSLDQPALSR